jgi:glycosyltransferase involved in cell wall biosynthesis/SAM-dependent methyltransferase
MLNACTIIACNYLPFARVLADSFFDHHADGRFTVLLVDDERRQFTPGDDRVDWRRLADIGLEPDEVCRLAGIYDVTELSTAVKPLLLRRLLDDGRDPVVYLDPDIRIFASLEDVATLAARHGTVLTPHTMQPYPKDERQIDGFFVLAAGVYNLGFIGVSGSARPFLDWWWQRTRREALIDVTKMMFTDQRWVDFVPGLFDHFILKDPGYNVAYWNLHARDFSTESGRYVVDGKPLRFFHFSGFDTRKPWLLSKHQGSRPRVLLSERPALARICREYLDSLVAAGIHAESKPPYGWSRLPSGVSITTRMRRLYWSALVCAEQGTCAEPPSPFDSDDPDAFLNWLNAPAEGGPRRVSRFLYSIYSDRVDLQMHFPDIFGTHASAYANWIWQDGVRQENIPLELLPPREVSEPEDAAQPAPAPRELREGVNIAGYFRAELGIGEAARQLMSAIETAGIPHATTTYDATLSRQLYPFAERDAGGALYDINLLCVNADSTPRFARDMGPAFFDGRHTAGYWFWEVEEFPDSMHAAFDVVDEVWTATSFIGDAVRAAGSKPVFTVPIPVPVPRYSESITRARFDLPDRFAFLLIFDFLSVVERKNPLGLIEAFTKAFRPDEGPILVIKSINGHLRLTELERLRAATGGRRDVLIVDRYYTEEEKNALVGACDCYISLHRSEGYGLTMAEAMALGKPVIATGYSGNLHFMTAENSYLVDYARVNVPAGCQPYPTSACWADPDLDHAAALMCEVHERPDSARARAKKGQADVLELHGRDTSARAIVERVSAIRRDRRSRVNVGEMPSTGGAPVHKPSEPAPPVTIEQLEALLGPLTETSTLRLSADGRSLPGLRLFAQRALFRVLRPLWFQQHQFHGQVVAAIGLTAGALRTEQRAREAVDAKMHALTSKLLATRREADRLARLVDRLELEERAHASDRARLASALDAARDVQQQRAALGELSTKVSELRATSSTFQENTGTHLEALTAAVQKTESDVVGLTKASSTFHENAAAHLEALTTAVQGTEKDLADLTNRLFAVPYMSDPSRFHIKDAQGRDQLGYRGRAEAKKGFYLEFEEVFRGPESLIREHQAAFVPLLRSRTHVVDLGCGRGEMLDLLKEAAIPAVGIDIDPDMVRHCRSKGHAVEEKDALQFLRELPAASVEAIFCAQVIEHMTYGDLKEFLELSRSRLRPGGVLIAETVNPHALEAFKTFHTDLTHQRPIFPEVALALAQLAGFEDAGIMFPRGTGELESDRRSQGEYAIVAMARGEGPVPQ